VEIFTISPCLAIYVHNEIESRGLHFGIGQVCGGTVAAGFFSRIRWINSMIKRRDTMRQSVGFRIVLVAVVLALSLPLTIQPAHSAIAAATLTGTVSCSRCHGLHARKGTNRLSCTMLCVSQDAHYVLLVGDKSYDLVGDRNAIQNFGGGDATVTGRLTGDTIEVATIGHENQSRQTKSR
jgi:hypothetical protein